MRDSWLSTDGRQLADYRWETARCVQMGESWLLTADERQLAAYRWEAVDCLQMGGSWLLTDGRELTAYRWEAADCLQMGDSWLLLIDGIPIAAYRWETVGYLHTGDSWLLTNGKQLAAYTIHNFLHIYLRRGGEAHYCVVNPLAGNLYSICKMHSRLSYCLLYLIFLSFRKWLRLKWWLRYYIGLIFIWKNFHYTELIF